MGWTRGTKGKGTVHEGFDNGCAWREWGYKEEGKPRLTWEDCVKIDLEGL